MRLGAVAIAAVGCSGCMAQPPLAQVAAQPDDIAQSEPHELRFSVAGTRTATMLHWQVNSNGRGTLRAPDIVGYNPVQLLANDPVYHIAPGTHEFDIGPAGYDALRQFLELVIDVRRDPNSPLTLGLDCTPSIGSGSVKVTWTDSGGGELSLSNQCLTPFGAQFHDRMVETWFVLARSMHESGHTAVTVIEQPTLPAPSKLAFTQTGIWTPSSIRWEINGAGKGWILQSSGNEGQTGSQSQLRDGGRFWFQLDTPFHQAILRSFAPYLEGTAQSGSCEDELTTTDQPLVLIEWADANGTLQNYRSDLGCPSFAARTRRVKEMFEVLLEKGSLGGSVMLFGRDQSQDLAP